MKITNYSIFDALLLLIESIIATNCDWFIEGFCLFFYNSDSVDRPIQRFLLIFEIG